MVAPPKAAPLHQGTLLYDKGEKEHQKATCIADGGEFWSGGGDVTIENGLPLLKSISYQAFQEFKGAVKCQGD